MLFKNNELGFTLTIYDNSPEGCSKIELPTPLVIKICRNMRILKQIWFNFKANEADIIKSKKRTLELHRSYNITQKDFLLLINAVKNSNELTDLTLGDIKSLRNLLNTLGGNPKLENRLDEIQKKWKYDFNSSKEERYFKTVIKPGLDFKEKFKWRQFQAVPGNTGVLFETFKINNNDGYILVSKENDLYCFRKRK